MEGDAVEVFIKNAAGKESETQSVTLKAGSQTASLTLGPPAATLKVVCDPADAKVKVLSGSGEVTAAKDHSMVAGEALVEGASIRVACVKDGYIRKANRNPMKLKAGENTIKLKMFKVGEAPVATGTLLVNSYPYAKCTVRGQTKGVPAKFMGIPATSTRVTCKKGSVKKTKSVRVKANTTTRLNFKPNDYQ